MFCLREKVVYLGHGVAEISRIIEKNISGKATQFFELKLIHDKTTVLVPTANLNGMRKLISRTEVENIIFKTLSEVVEKTDCDNEFKIVVAASSWARRNRQYQNEISSGDIKKLIKIFKTLKTRSLERPLSFGEKGLLAQAEFLLVQEIALVENVDEDCAKRQLNSYFPCNAASAEPLVKTSVKTKM